MQDLQQLQQLAGETTTEGTIDDVYMAIHEGRKVIMTFDDYADFAAFRTALHRARDTFHQAAAVLGEESKKDTHELKADWAMKPEQNNTLKVLGTFYLKLRRPSHFSFIIAD